jgi:hypothetical protein
MAMAAAVKRLGAEKTTKSRQRCQKVGGVAGSDIRVR